MKPKMIVPTLLMLIAVAGCQHEQAKHGHAHNHTPQTPQTFSLPDGIDASVYALSAEPDGAHNVIAARDAVQDDQDIVILGRIGGGENPWVEGRAAFSIVDPSLRACSDIPGDDCPVPWDYCCETDKLPTSMALVTIVDEEGQVIKADARALLDVKELSTVVVKGKAKRDDAGNLTVLASGVYIKSM